jgi:hypothetical protein
MHFSGESFSLLQIRQVDNNVHNNTIFTSLYINHVSKFVNIFWNKCVWLTWLNMIIILSSHSMVNNLCSCHDIVKLLWILTLMCAISFLMTWVTFVSGSWLEESPLEGISLWEEQPTAWYWQQQLIQCAFPIKCASPSPAAAEAAYSCLHSRGVCS